MSDPTPLPAPRYEHFILRAVLALVLIASFVLKLQNLGHPSVKGLDESFHAVVATNLMKHPLTPTLMDQPYLPADPTDWQNTQVWLHKPILPLWQMAASMKIGGVNTLAMRMPSAVLGTLAALLTYSIARRWVDERAGLVAGALMAFCPMTWMLTHGYLFSDHVDISLLFWTLVGIWLLAEGMEYVSNRCERNQVSDPLVTGERASPALLIHLFFALAGVGQGLAFLSKTFPALVISGLAVVAILVAKHWERRGMKWSHLMTLIVATFFTAGSWTLYTAIRFPEEFVGEYRLIFSHLGANVEGWANPWDRVLFDYWINAFHVFYPACLTAAVLLVWPTLKERSVGLVMVYAWTLGVLVPHLLSVSKTPSMTLIGWPPVFILLGAMVSRSTRGSAPLAAALAACAVAGVFFFGKVPSGGFGLTPRLMQLVWDSRWVVFHIATAVVAFGAVFVFVRSKPETARGASLVFVIIATLAGGMMSFRYVRKAIQVTQIPGDRPDLTGIGAFFRQSSPENAVILIEMKEKLEDKMLMFSAGRMVYGLTPGQFYEPKAREIVAAGGKVYLVTERKLELPIVKRAGEERRMIYEVTP